MHTKILKPLYGNWISGRLIHRFMRLLLLSGIVEVVLLVFIRGWLPLKLLLAFLMVLSLTCIIFFYRARWWFDAEGGNIQNKILELLISRIEWDGNGRALDIGCGSGALTIKLAGRYNDAEITGIDYWDNRWDYCQKQCDENARIENVAYRTKFQRASASKLPFQDETFDLVVSNLTFHEVMDSKSKPDVLREALRVVKKGGKFVFQDLFLIKYYYGTPDELFAAIKATGVKEIKFEDTSTSSFIPKTLKLPFMLGTLGLIYGEK